MASLIAVFGEAVSSAPTLREALSGVFGSVSFTAWICLLLPQLITNYKAKSADGLSMGFLFIWLLGDFLNLSGALCTGDLAPTAVALGSYFVFADIVLISQCSYYNALNAQRRSRHREPRHVVGTDTPASFETDATAIATEDEPLLARQRSNSIGLPGSHRRHSIRHAESNLDPLARIITGEDDSPDSDPWLHNTLSLLAVWIIGIAGWFLSVKMGAWDSGNDASTPETSAAPIEIIGMTLGYLSSVCYLCARIPQIMKNWREKSTEGLAILFFLLSLTGNSTYGASLLVYASNWKEFIKTIPWLLGSLGTIFEDAIIFVQFRMYSPRRQVKDRHAVAVCDA